MPSNRHALRDATQPAHALAEARWTGPDGFASVASYRDWLRSLYSAHAALGLAAAQTLGDDSVVREEVRRLEALKCDLRCAGSDRSWDGLGTESAAWGVLYALNGSAMGASILLKRGVATSWPQAYLRRMRDFAVSGDLVRFFARLDSAVLDRAAAVRGAEAVFIQVGSGSSNGRLVSA